MTFRYFAYGSNLWVPQMRSRCPSAKVVGVAHLDGWRLVCDKPSADGSVKFNIRPDPTAMTHGVVYEIGDGERQALDESEPRYDPIMVDLLEQPTLTYSFRDDSDEGLPYDWYVAISTLGAASHGLEDAALDIESTPDPMASGIRPATRDDLGLIQSILSEGLAADDGRYYIHPGDYAWWVYHDDPRYPEHLSTFVRDDSAFVTIDSLGAHENEMTVFARPGTERLPLVRWAQRRLRGRGEVGWVSDGDEELMSQLEAEGYRPGFVNHSYRWDLTGEVPEPDLPPGWSLRALAGEHEANSRRAASHAAFESTMPGAMHLQRYLDFMRSPVYVPDRDLVAVSPDGSIAAFMVWWGDPSGVAQIEPFGTHPDYQRRGIGRALMYHGLAGMRAAGMHTARVVTDRATSFYEGVGFDDMGPIWWWGRNA